jgi:hypothetical protein
VYATLADSFHVDQFKFSLPASQEEEPVPAPSIIGYKLRNRFMEDVALSKRRLDRTLPHLQGHRNDKKRLPCVLCCKQKEHLNGYNQSIYLQNIASHQRLGLNTSLRCSICNVTLCKVLRWGPEGNCKSCFEIWHTSTDLPDPCLVDTFLDHQDPQTTTAPHRTEFTTRRTTSEIRSDMPSSSRQSSQLNRTSVSSRGSLPTSVSISSVSNGPETQS